MNKAQVLDWLVRDAEENGDRFEVHGHRYDGGHARGLLSSYEGVLRKMTESLGYQRDVSLPKLPSDESEAVALLRERLKDEVSLVSAVLQLRYPERFLFYRVSALEDSIFEGLEFLGEVAPELRLPFSQVGAKGFERYLALNDALLSFARLRWPKVQHPQGRIAYLLYQGLAPLFLEKSEYRRYWTTVCIDASDLSVTVPLRLKGTVTWNGHWEMKPGDLVFLYQAAPRSAIVGLYRVAAEPRFDPWGGWDGFWVDLAKVCDVPDITLEAMRNDAVFKQWSVVRRNYGVRTEPIPHSIYNALLGRIPESLREAQGLTTEPVAAVGKSGQFASEAEFEDSAIEPLLRKWGFHFQRQHHCAFRIGSQDHHCRVDFLVRDERGPLTLFEDKLRILGKRDLEPAHLQGRSYALQLGLPSFVVAAPEGLWLYSTDRGVDSPVLRVSSDELGAQEEQLRTAIVRLRR